MKKLLLLFIVITAIIFAGCTKAEEGPKETVKSNVEIAIEATGNKTTATSLVVNGKLNDEDWLLLKNIREQLPMVENITLNDVTNIKAGVFSFKENEIVWVVNHWLKSIKAPKAVTVESLAFLFCDELINVDLASVEVIGEESFGVCESLESLFLPKAHDISADAFIGCSSLKNLKLGYTEAIVFKLENESKMKTQNINLDIVGVEATLAIGKIWKNNLWKSISNNGQLVPKADFEIANWGCSLGFIETHEKRKAISGGGSQKRIYEGDGDGCWYYYNFDENGKLISGEIDFSHQFSSENTDLIFLPINSYITILDELKEEYSEPIYMSEDVYSYNMTDKEYRPGYAWYEAQSIMNGNKSLIYKFRNERTEIESELRQYTRSGQYMPLGFTVRTTYSDLL